MSVVVLKGLGLFPKTLESFLPSAPGCKIVVWDARDPGIAKQPTPVSQLANSTFKVVKAIVSWFIVMVPKPGTDIGASGPMKNPNSPLSIRLAASKTAATVLAFIVSATQFT